MGVRGAAGPDRDFAVDNPAAVGMAAEGRPAGAGIAVRPDPVAAGTAAEPRGPAVGGTAAARDLRRPVAVLVGRAAQRVLVRVHPVARAAAVPSDRPAGQEAATRQRPGPATQVRVRWLAAASPGVGRQVVAIDLLGPTGSAGPERSASSSAARPAAVRPPAQPAPDPASVRQRRDPRRAAGLPTRAGRRNAAVTMVLPARLPVRGCLVHRATPSSPVEPAVPTAVPGHHLAGCPRDVGSGRCPARVDPLCPFRRVPFNPAALPSVVQCRQFRVDSATRRGKRPRPRARSTNFVCLATARQRRRRCTARPCFVLTLTRHGPSRVGLRCVRSCRPERRFRR